MSTSANARHWQHQHFEEWLDWTEDQIQSALHECSPRNWNEDVITRAWLRRLVAPQTNFHIEGLGRTLGIEWDAYKASGKLETEYGDIAVVVRQKFRQGKTITGVAFLEAKRSYAEHRECYFELDSEQLQRHADNTPHHRLLMYSEKCDSRHIPTLLQHGLCMQCHGRLHSINAMVMPSVHALALNSTEPANLHALTIPLSVQICSRYLAGYDLDYSTKLLDRVVKAPRGGIKFLLVAHVGVGTDQQPEPLGPSLRQAGYTHIDDEEEGETRVEGGPRIEPPLMER